jgi:hypothetical protein
MLGRLCRSSEGPQAISTTETHSHLPQLKNSLHNHIFQLHKPRHVDLVVQKLSDEYIWTVQLKCRNDCGMRRSYVHRAFLMHKYHIFPATRELNIPPILVFTLIGLILLCTLWVAFLGLCMLGILFSGPQICNCPIPVYMAGRRFRFSINIRPLFLH